MKENLEQFKATFIERYDREARDRFSLSDRIRELVELNHSIGLETRKLTNALKGNAKVQGDWGNDTRQHPRTLRIPPRTRLPGAGNRSHRRRLASATDVVINYTEGRKIIIDSKVSIQSYLGMLDATDDDRRQTLAKAHVASVKKHITELRNKSYQDFVGSDRVDFVLMFIPHGRSIPRRNEPRRFPVADRIRQPRADNLPTHLMSVVRLVEQMWRHDKTEPQCNRDSPTGRTDARQVPRIHRRHGAPRPLHNRGTTPGTEPSTNSRQVQATLSAAPNACAPSERKPQKNSPNAGKPKPATMQQTSPPGSDEMQHTAT